MNLMFGKTYRIPWFDVSGHVADDTLLTCQIVRKDWSSVAILTASNSPDIPNLFFFSEWQPITEDAWAAHIVYDGVTLQTIEVSAGQRVTPFTTAGTPVQAYRTAADFPAASPEPVVTVRFSHVDSTGASVTSVDVAATFVDASYAYVADAYDFPENGLYAAVWFADNIPLVADVLLIDKLVGKEALQVCLRDNAGDPHAVATVILSKADGTAIDQCVTDDRGLAYLRAYPGQYILSVVKAGVAFSVNNYAVEVVNTDLNDTQNRLFYNVGSFRPSLAGSAISIPTCGLYCDLFTMTGVPLPNAEIQVTVLNGPNILAGTGVFNVRQVYCTDSYGRASMQLMRGIDVDITIAPTGVRRQIRVPDEAGPVNLLTLMERANDPFTIVRPNIPAAPRREI